MQYHVIKAGCCINTCFKVQYESKSLHTSAWASTKLGYIQNADQLPSIALISFFMMWYIDFRILLQKNYIKQGRLKMLDLLLMNGTIHNF